MNGRHLLAALAGGLTLFVLGFLVYGLALASFLQANAGSAAGAMRSPPLVWAIAAGDLVYGVFLTMLFARNPALSSLRRHVALGGVTGLLTSLASGLLQYATHDVANITATAVSSIAFAVLAAAAGGVIGMILGSAGSSRTRVTT
ncbi:MAG TPA: hypothetical protein VG736_02285 [Vicinamibacterales bacterium]|jgi:hypothetical protein|nr:hypothetical protein [Vicinamibacterales bacterium]